jgi:hypothetical protein
LDLFLLTGSEPATQPQPRIDEYTGDRYGDGALHKRGARLRSQRQRQH